MTKNNIVLSFSTALILTANSLYAKESKKLENVVVTAQKSEENIQQIPMSVNLIDEFSMEDSSIKSIKDLSSYIPNLSTTFSGQRDSFSRIAIRGITNGGLTDEAVALYVDDVYIDKFGYQIPFFDIERIEVIKGPQGTLYGKNTEAGVINVITKAPSNIFEGKINLEAGSFKYKKLETILNVPILQNKLFLKLSGLKLKRDGYIKNLYDNSRLDNQKTLSSKANLLYKITDKLELNLITSYTKLEDEGGYPQVPLDKQTFKNVTGLKNIDDFETSFNYKGDGFSKTNMQVLKLKYNFDNFDFIGITSHRKLDNKNTMDGDLSPAEIFIGINQRDSKSFNQEFRISNNKNNSFKWLLGTYLAKEDSTISSGYQFQQAGAAAYGMPVGTKQLYNGDLDSRDLAIFTQSTIIFLDDKLGITAGARYEKSKRAMDKRTHQLNGIDVTTPMKDLEKSSSIFLPKLSIDYKFTPDNMLYTSFSKGYKAGGYSVAVDDINEVGFEAETSKSFELGFKSSFPNLNLTFNTALFYTKVDDFQDEIELDVRGIVIRNATTANIKGAEFESQLALSDKLSLQASLGFTKGEYGDYIDPNTKQNYKGNKIAFIPKYNANLALKYRNEIGLFGNFELANVGDRYFYRDNKTKVDGYTIANVKIGYEQDDWDIYFGVKNITNKQYASEGYNNTLNNVYMSAVGAPRTFNVAFNYRF